MFQLRLSDCGVVLVFALVGGLSPQLEGQTSSYTGVDLYTLTAPTGDINPSFNAPAPMDGALVAGWGVAGSYPHAIFWSPSGTPTDLEPTNLSGFSESFGLAGNNGQQVGYGGGTATGLSDSFTYKVHALLWTGSASSAIDLNPTNLTGFVGSRADGIYGSQQVGFGSIDGVTSHALLWSGSAGSAVDLNPAPLNIQSSIAYGTDGAQQVGYGVNNGTNHALLWSGSAASAVDLHPTQLSYLQSSEAFGVANGQQVGYGGEEVVFDGGVSPTSHALLWNGTAVSAVDLNPASAFRSIAYATNSAQQAGFTSTAPTAAPHATVWAGSAASAVDLQALLPNFASSMAYSINAAGDVFGLASDSSAHYHAVAWLAAPHTASSAVAGGSNQTATVAGRSTQSGDVKVTFPTASSGNFTSIDSISTSTSLATQTGTINFALPSGSSLLESWDLSFSGTFTGPATLVFHYDPSYLAPGLDPSDLQIEHFVGGQWVPLDGTVDAADNLITVSTDSLSPFALGAVPEPIALPLAVLATALLLRRR